MAKKKEVKKFEFSKVGSILDNIAKSVPILVEKEIKEKQREADKLEKEIQQLVIRQCSTTQQVHIMLQ